MHTNYISRNEPHLSKQSFNIDSERYQKGHLTIENPKILERDDTKKSLISSNMMDAQEQKQLQTWHLSQQSAPKVPAQRPTTGKQIRDRKSFNANLHSLAKALECTSAEGMHYFTTRYENLVEQTKKRDWRSQRNNSSKQTTTAGSRNVFSPTSGAFSQLGSHTSLEKK